MNEQIPKQESRTTIERSLRVGYESLPDPSHPERNEDSFFSLSDLGIFGVADGMGGHVGGDEASRAVIAGSKKFFAEHRYDLPPDQVPAFMVRGMESGVLALHEVRKKYEGVERRPDTTLTLAKIIKQGEEFFLAYAHVGDSRIYVLRREGALEQVTQDDDFLSKEIFVAAPAELKQALREKIDSAKIPEDLGTDISPHLGVSPDFLFHKRNQVSHSLGKYSASRVQSGVVPLRIGDVVLLTSDGVHDNLTPSDIKEALLQGQTAEERAAFVVGRAQGLAALSREEYMRAKQDDTTAFVIEVAPES